MRAHFINEKLHKSIYSCERNDCTTFLIKEQTMQTFTIKTLSGDCLLQLAGAWKVGP